MELRLVPMHLLRHLEEESTFLPWQNTAMIENNLLVRVEVALRGAVRGDSVTAVSYATTSRPTGFRSVSQCPLPARMLPYKTV